MRTKTLILSYFLYSIIPSYAQTVVNVEMDDLSVHEVILLPKESDLASNLTNITKVKTGDPSLKRSAPFESQLKKLLIKTVNNGGNVLEITHFEDHKQAGLYNLKGEVLHTDNFDTLKNEITSLKEKRQVKKCAYLTIYRPVYNYSLNDLSVVYLTIKTDEFKVKANSKYIIKLTEEGVYNLEVGGSKTAVKIDVKFGNDYFVRCYVYPPGIGMIPGTVMVPIGGYTASLKIIEDKVQGEIESSFVKRYY